MRGMTLIETMIAVALIGIAGVTVGHAAQRQRLDGQEALQRARAEELLAYHAERAVHDERPDADVSSRLTAGLPRASVKVADQGATRTVTVRWGNGDALHTRSLVVFAGKRR